MEVGDLVDFWTPINEPIVVVASGYFNVPGVFAGNFPPGVLNFAALPQALRTWWRPTRRPTTRSTHSTARGACRARPESHRLCAGDAANPARRQRRTDTPLPLQPPLPRRDRAATRRERRRRAVEPGEMHRTSPARPTSSASTTTSAGGSGSARRSRRRPALRLPAHHVLPVRASPYASPCPTTCTDFGWEIYPPG